MTGEEYKDGIEQLLQLVQREYRQINEIRELTEELTEAFGRDDQVSVQMLLKMRGNSMSEADKVKKQKNMILSALGGNERIQKLINGEHISGMTETEKRICMIAAGKKETLAKPVELDRYINRRITGGKSFYDK